MKVKSVSAIAVEIPLRKTFGGSRYNVASRCTIITRIETDQGLISEVYNGDNRQHQKELVAIIEDELGPLVVGEEIFAIERIWQKMFRTAEWNRDRKLVMEAIACVDSALWDLIGKAAGLNVCRLLGGYRSEIPIISIGGYYENGKTLADLGREMEWLKAHGIGGCKVKVGGLSPEADAERVAAARAGAGDDFVIAVDANRGWSVADATRFARLVERWDIAWFEEPCHWHDDAFGMAEVRRRTPIPINAGQSEATSHGVRRLLAEGAVDIVNFDASEAGGITEWRRVAAMCGVSGVRLAHHEEPQIAMQMLSAVPHGICVECFADPERDPIWDGMIVNRPPIANGVIQVPQGAGFGLELNWDLIGRYRLN
ncbi:mandelate racemase/muconate lactonizing enzyme family protein [Chelatococcus sp. GCM10030263]|uniref:mandelate racemase/muconate lactonizing enzyme family protein n=1 Tax=Chelatococcus sp. GCM10030263 TaxID=3273387 RepID=UPI00360C20C2